MPFTVRVCLQRRPRPEQDHADGDHGEVVGGALFVARGDAAELLEAVDGKRRVEAVLPRGV
jgi:hypothetical protein